MCVTRQDIYNKVRDILVDALGVDEDEITPDATLVGNLGAESIDFLDIVYNLEKTFDVEIPRGDLIPDDILTNVKFLENGRMNATGIAKLRQRMPFADLAKFEANPIVADFASLLTVNDMCGFVDGKLKRKAA